MTPEDDYFSALIRKAVGESVTIIQANDDGRASHCMSCRKADPLRLKAPMAKKFMGLPSSPGSSEYVASHAKTTMQQLEPFLISGRQSMPYHLPGSGFLMTFIS